MRECAHEVEVSDDGPRFGAGRWVEIAGTAEAACEEEEHRRG